MKTIGIITIQKCGNFGADLQAYALGAKLRMLGYEAENIDYLFYKHPRHRTCAESRPIFKLGMVNRAKEMLFPVLSAVKGFRRRREMRARHARFADWFAQHVRCGREYRSVRELRARPPRYDVYMVGSDQVWNPRMGSSLLPYFLDFAPEGARCVSYASSIGVSELPGPVFLKYRELLRRFSHVGLREARGAELVRRMKLEAEVAHVLDPTLLLSADEWAAVAQKPESVPEAYLLLYDLVQSPETVELAHRVAQTRGLRVVRMGDGGYGPGEFIWLFAHADCVVTNSFHGTAFSLIHGKDFVSVIPRGMANAGRIESILKVVGLESQLVRAEAVSGMGDIPTIDWPLVHDRLDAARSRSVDFLVRSVEGERRIPEKRPIGSLPKACFAVWNPDASVRAASTSGGVFSLLAEATIRRGGVVYGAAFDSDFKHVRHVAAETVADLAPLRKSKYVYSEAAPAIADAVGKLKAGREVLFSGCPCQCAAMKAAAKGCDEGLTTVDFVCHGTPRPEVFAAYVEELEKRHGGKLTRYEFRNKDRGWNFQNIVYAFDNGRTVRTLPWLDSFFHGFSVNAFLRSSCYACPFASLERVSDITIADCWRVAASHPQWDDNRGTSLVLGNSEKGVRLLDDIGVARLPGGLYPLELAEKRNAALMQPAVRSCFEARFSEVFAATMDFGRAAACFMTSRRRMKYWIVYWVKKIGWFYFKHHQ